MMKRHRRSKKRRYKAWTKTGTAIASHYITHIDDLEPQPVGLLARVSSARQEKNGHLNHQVIDASWELERKGFEVAVVFRETGAGRAKKRADLKRLSACSA